MDRNQVFQLVARCVSSIVPELSNRQLVRQDNLAELGVNSVDRTEVVIMALENLGIRVPLVALAGASNLGELADAIHERA